jgi:DnaK suppressor protein
MAKKVQKSKSAAKKPTKPVAKKAAKPVAKKAVKPSAKKVVKPVAKKVVKPVAKKVVKPVTKKVVKPVAKKVVKPIAKKTSKAAASKTKAKVVAKKTVKPVAKKIAKPVKKVVKVVAKKVSKVAPAKAKAKVTAKKPVKAAPTKAIKVIAKKVTKPVAKQLVKVVAKKVVKTVALKVEKTVAKKAVEVPNLKPEKKVSKRAKKFAPPPPMFVKPIPVKPKTVAELIEANKIPVEKNFPISKRELKTVRPAIDNTALYGNDKPVKAPIIGKTKFNDAELKEFKELINFKLAEAIKDYELLKDTLSHRDNNGTDDTSPTFKLLEDGSEVMSKEETTQLAIRQEKFIQNLKNALIRIENKTYGVCRATGNMISKDRLRSVPHATLSIEAKREQG